MIERGFFYNTNGWMQLFFFFIIILFCLIFGSFILLIFGIISEESSSIRMTLSIQQVSIFLAPSILFAYLFHNNPKDYLRVEGAQNINTISLVVMLIIVIQPFIYLLGYLNQQLILPESMSALTKLMQEGERVAEESLSLFLSDKSVTGIILNFLTIAVIAAFVEEIFFRGCLQQIIQKIVSNKHAAVWITAIIFSAIHFQFYGFVPRLLLGAVLGYLFLWSGSLWIPVLAHTVHNAINVTLLQIYYGTPEYDKMENMDINNHIWLAVVSFVLMSVLLFFIRKNKVLEQLINNK